MNADSYGSTGFITYKSSAYYLALFALFLAGFATFALLYAVQPILPELATSFQVNAATSSLALSLPTFALALCLLVSGALSESLGRKPVMFYSLLVSSGLGLACAFANNWQTMLVLRTLLGISLSGLPALAMAYISEEFEAKALPAAMGLYISGTALGGLIGRVVAGLLSDLGGWPLALGGLALLSLIATLTFVLLLPRSKHFIAEPLSFKGLSHNFIEHLFNPRLQALFLTAFLLMGSFVTLFNYIGFHLSAAPFNLSSTLIGFIFLVYIFGVISSGLSGKISHHFGIKGAAQRLVGVLALGIILCLMPFLPAIILGLMLCTVGFFTAHAITSGLIGKYATKAKAQASSLYLCAYYLGSSALGYANGWVFELFSWEVLLLLLLGYLSLILILSRRF